MQLLLCLCCRCTMFRHIFVHWVGTNVRGKWMKGVVAEVSFVGWADTVCGFYCVYFYWRSCRALLTPAPAHVYGNKQ